MSGFTEKRASDASEQPSGEPVVLTWGAAGAMLPLVERIAADVVRQHDRLALLQPEKNRLDRNRWQLAWPERARRYQLQEETADAEKELLEAIAELEVLGLALLHGPTGMIGFPTVVNDRAAYFSGDPARRRWPSGTMPTIWCAVRCRRPGRARPKNANAAAAASRVRSGK